MPSDETQKLTFANPFPPFRPRMPWIGADLQTIRDVLIPTVDPFDPAHAAVVDFPMQDGTGDRLTGMLERPRTPVDGRPLAILIHGLTGCAESRYVRRAAGRLLHEGYPVLRLNLRGAGTCRPLCREQYHSGRSEDLDAVLGQLPAELLSNGLVLVGWSLGGNVLLKGLAEFGGAYPIRAAAAISAPIDLAEAAERFRAPRNLLYHWWLLRRMKLEMAASPVPLTPEARRTLARVRGIIEFDEAFTAPRNGFASAADYYACCSAIGFMPAIKVPTLVLHALDDPWIPGAAYQAFDWSANPSLVPLLPRFGGHTGFHGAGGRVWSDDCLLSFLDGVLGR